MILEPLLADDPVASFWSAHLTGEVIGLATSGTISRKGRTVVRTTASWVDSFPYLAQWIGLTSDDVVWVPGTLRATMNLFAVCLAEWVGASWSVEPEGATVAQLTPAGLAEALSEDRLSAPAARQASSMPPATDVPLGTPLSGPSHTSGQTHTAGPPQTSKVTEASGLTASIQKVIVAGASLGSSLAAKASAAGLSTYHYYGASELSLVAYGSTCENLRLFPQVEVEIRDRQIWVRSPWLSQGYAEPDAVGFLTDTQGWASVGDEGALHGDHLRVLGRSGGLTVGGQTIALEPLTETLQRYATHPLALVGVPQESYGDVLACILTSADDLETVRTWARANLQGADRPRLWRVIDSLPLTDAGKLDSLRLSKLVASRSRLGGTQVDTKTPKAFKRN